MPTPVASSWVRPPSGAFSEVEPLLLLVFDACVKIVVVVGAWLSELVLGIDPEFGGVPSGDGTAAGDVGVNVSVELAGEVVGVETGAVSGGKKVVAGLEASEGVFAGGVVSELLLDGEDDEVEVSLIY